METRIRIRLEELFGEQLGSKLVDAVKRALWTFVEVLLGGIVANATFDLDWRALFTMAGLAMIASFMKSMGIGMPESCPYDGELNVMHDDETPYGGVTIWKKTAEDLIRQGELRLMVREHRDDITS